MSHIKKCGDPKDKVSTEQPGIEAAESNESISTSREACPLCLQDLEASSKASMSHIARHLEAVALMSIPPSHADCDDATSTISDEETVSHNAEKFAEAAIARVSSSTAKGDTDLDLQLNEPLKSNQLKRSSMVSERSDPYTKNPKSKRISSYWSIAEKEAFPGLLQQFGTDFQWIASHMQTKSVTMVNHFFQQRSFHSFEAREFLFVRVWTLTCVVKVENYFDKLQKAGGSEEENDE